MYARENNNLKCIRPIDINPKTMTTITSTIEHCISTGFPILLENIGEDIEPVFDPVLNLKFKKAGSSLLLIVGDKEIDFHPDFKFIMTTKLSRPHYTPEICVKVTILNF